MKNNLKLITFFVNIVKKHNKRFIKFGAVGFSGALVNLIIVWLCNNYIYSSIYDFAKTLLSYVTGIIISIFTNFILNYIWTWQDKKLSGKAQFFYYLAKFYGVSILSAVIQLSTSYSLFIAVKYLKFSQVSEVPILYKQLTVIAGIGFAMFFNYFLNHYWTFNKSLKD